METKSLQLGVLRFACQRSQSVVSKVELQKPRPSFEFRSRSCRVSWAKSASDRFRRPGQSHHWPWLRSRCARQLGLCSPRQKKDRRCDLATTPKIYRLSQPIPGLERVEVTEALAADRYSHERLRELLKPILKRYDTILIDTPPSLCWLTESALIASEYALVAATPEFYSVKGLQRLSQFMESISQRHALKCSVLFFPSGIPAAKAIPLSSMSLKKHSPKNLKIQSPPRYLRFRSVDLRKTHF